MSPDPTQTALLIMDVQPPIADIGGPTLLERLADGAAAARTAGVAVIYAKVGFRPGYPEIGPRANAMLTRIKETGAFVDDVSEVHESIAPQTGEIVVTRPRVSAFSGGDLDVVLRARSIDSLVLTGIATSGAVLSTLRQAADLDFDLTVLSDGCADSDDEVHRVLIEKVFPSQARVMTVRGWTTEVVGQS
jgi:nicotinamidase-related amidase